MSKTTALKILIIVAGLGLIGGVSYVVIKNGDKSNQQSQDTSQKDIETKISNENTSPNQTTPSPAPAPTPKPFQPSASMIENITSIMNTLNTQPFEGYVANEVTLYYESAEPATVLKDKTQIAGTLQYFDDAITPWDFNLPQNEIDHYKKKFPSLFTDSCLAGHAADANMVVSFCFTPESKIHSIFFCRDPRNLN